MGIVTTVLLGGRHAGAAMTGTTTTETTIIMGAGRIVRRTETPRRRMDARGAFLFRRDLGQWQVTVAPLKSQ
jgi:hypothetical protein